MDFGSLLSVAQKNAKTKTNSERSKFYSTKFEPPKKESKEKKLSDGIKKFLAQKEQEERREKEKKRKEYEELMALRTESEKNKIKKHLKVTKSANKSVLEDAINKTDTAVTMEGPEQPDEDDYVYTSNEASALTIINAQSSSSIDPDILRRLELLEGRSTVTAAPLTQYGGGNVDPNVLRRLELLEGRPITVPTTPHHPVPYVMVPIPLSMLQHAPLQQQVIQASAHTHTIVAPPTQSVPQLTAQPIQSTESPRSVCPICKDEDNFTNVVFLECSHMFCEGCVASMEEHQLAWKCGFCNTISDYVIGFILAN